MTLCGHTLKAWMFIWCSEKIWVIILLGYTIIISLVKVFNLSKSRAVFLARNFPLYMHTNAHISWNSVVKMPNKTECCSTFNHWTTCLIIISADYYQSGYMAWQVSWPYILLFFVRENAVRERSAYLKHSSCFGWLQRCWERESNVYYHCVQRSLPAVN